MKPVWLTITHCGNAENQCFDTLCMQKPACLARHIPGKLKRMLLTTIHYKRHMQTNGKKVGSDVGEDGAVGKTDVCCLGGPGLIPFIV